MRATYYKWWERYTVDRDFRNIDRIARRMFGFELPEDVDPGAGEDSDRRLALTWMTDVMVVRVMKRRSRRSANAALTEMSAILGPPTLDSFVDYRAAVRLIRHRRGEAWMKAWKTHFRTIVFATFHLSQVEGNLEKYLPCFLFHIETCDESLDRQE
jgi:hypothetical protein